jgi:hypothetical protein
MAYLGNTAYTSDHNKNKLSNLFTYRDNKFPKLSPFFNERPKKYPDVIKKNGTANREALIIK